MGYPNKLTSYLLGLDDFWVMARNGYAEARSQIYLGEVAVDWVVMNRAKVGWSGRIGDNHVVAKTPKEVILQNYQFSWTRTNDPNYEIMFSPWKYNKKAWDRSKEIARKVLDDLVPDPTKGATFYLNVAVTKKYWGLPDWYDEDKITVIIADHTFLKI